MVARRERLGRSSARARRWRPGRAASCARRRARRARRRCRSPRCGSTHDLHVDAVEPRRARPAASGVVADARRSASRRRRRGPATPRRSPPSRRRPQRDRAPACRCRRASGLRGRATTSTIRSPSDDDAASRARRRDLRGQRGVAQDEADVRPQAPPLGLAVEALEQERRDVACRGRPPRPPRRPGPRAARGRAARGRSARRQRVGDDDAAPACRRSLARGASPRRPPRASPRASRPACPESAR